MREFEEDLFSHLLNLHKSPEVVLATNLIRLPYWSCWRHNPKSFFFHWEEPNSMIKLSPFWFGSRLLFRSLASWPDVRKLCDWKYQIRSFVMIWPRSMTTKAFISANSIKRSCHHNKLLVVIPLYIFGMYLCTHVGRSTALRGLLGDNFFKKFFRYRFLKNNVRL